MLDKNIPCKEINERHNIGQATTGGTQIAMHYGRKSVRQSSPKTQ